jgi:hypothetical protein
MRYMFTLIARNLQLLPRGTWQPQSCPVLGDGSRGHGARGGPRAVAGPGGGSWSHGARGSPGAVLCLKMGAGAMGHVEIPELSP